MPILTPPRAGLTATRSNAAIENVAAGHPHARDLAIWLPVNTGDNRRVREVVSGSVALPDWGTLNNTLGLEADISASTPWFYPRYDTAPPNVTISMWFRPGWNRLDPGPTHFWWFAAGSGGSASNLYRTTDEATFEWLYFTDNTSATTYIDTPSYALGDLIHVVLGHHYSTEGYVLWNGAFQTLLSGSTAGNTRPITVCGFGGDSLGNPSFSGQLIDFRVYTRLLSRSEALDLWAPETRWALNAASQTPRIWIPGVDAGAAAVTLAAGNQSVTVTAPTTSIAAALSLAAGNQSVTVTAPTVSFSLGGVNLSAGTQTANVTVPAATLAAVLTLAAGNQTVVVTAPSTAFALGGVSLAAGNQSATVTAPIAEIGSFIYLDAGAQTLTITVPATTFVLSGVAIAAGNQSVTATVPTAVAALGGLALAGGTQTLTMYAPTVGVVIGALVLADGDLTVTITAPLADLIGGEAVVGGRRLPILLIPGDRFDRGPIQGQYFQ